MGKELLNVGGGSNARLIASQCPTRPRSRSRASVLRFDSAVVAVAFVAHQDGARRLVFKQCSTVMGAGPFTPHIDSPRPLWP